MVNGELIITSEGENFLKVGEETFQVNNRTEATALFLKLGWDFMASFGFQIINFIRKNAKPQNDIEAVIESEAKLTKFPQNVFSAQALDVDEVGVFSVNVLLKMAKRRGTYTFPSSTLTDSLLRTPQ